MPVNTLITPSIVRVAENVLDQIYNFNPDDAPLLSMIPRSPISNVFFEWQRDSYRTPDPVRAAIEGADATYAVQAQPTLLNNRTQIFQDTVSVSNTGEVVKKYGRDSEAKRLKMKKMIELKRDQEAACLANPITVTGTAGIAGQQRGLLGFITNRRTGATGAAPNPVTNTGPTAGTLTAFDEAIFRTGLQTAYQNGGDASIVMCSPAHKVRISTFTANVQRTNEVGSKAPAVLNAAFDFYRSDFGVVKVVPNRVMAGTQAGLRNTVYIVDADKLALAVLRGFESEQLATVGDAKNHQVRTETSLVVRDEAPLYAIADCTITGA